MFFLRIIKFAWSDFVRNFWLSTVVIVVLILALSSVNALVGLNVMTSEMLKLLQDKINVNVFLQEKISAAQLANFQAYLSEIEEIEKVVYVSPEQALEQFRERHKNDPAVIDAVGELDRNPLLPTLIVSAKNANDYGKILAQIDSSEYSSLIKDKNFEDHQNIIGRINAFSEKARLVGLIFAVFFAVISILLIFNAIRITIYTHREEIGIMRLVGATNSFIRLPFIVESVFYGLFSVVITSALCFIICWLSAPYLNVFFGGYVPLIEYLRSGGVLVVGLELVGVVILTIISSGMAVARYLKV